MNNKKFFRKIGVVGFVVGAALPVMLTGCVGWAGGGGDYGGVVVAPEPDLYLFGGGYDRGRDVHVYSHRGAVSRGAAHPGGGHPGGGGHGGKR